MANIQKSNDITLVATSEYKQLVDRIDHLWEEAKSNAIQAVNTGLLDANWQTGRYISKNSRGGFWGKDAIETISRQLSAELPGLKGFSARNLRNMRTFYEEWRVFDSNLADTSAKSEIAGNLADASAKMKYNNDKYYV